jgi:hypothetical protein
MSECIPGPISFMLTITTSLLVLLLSLSFFFSTTIDIVPYSFVNLIALSNKDNLAQSISICFYYVSSSLVSSLYNILLLLLLSSLPFSISTLTNLKATDLSKKS